MSLWDLEARVRAELLEPPAFATRDSVTAKWLRLRLFKRHSLAIQETKPHWIL